MKVTVDVKNAQATEETRRGDMVAKGMMEVHFSLLPWIAYQRSLLPWIAYQRYVTANRQKINKSNSTFTCMSFALIISLSVPLF